MCLLIYTYTIIRCLSYFFFTFVVFLLLFVCCCFIAEKPIVGGSASPPIYGSSNVTGVSGERSDGERGNTNRKTSEHNFLDYLAFWRRGKNENISSPARTICMLQPNRNKEKRFCSNRISTTKYNIFTFLPLFLWDQFRRYANLFFLFISILQQIPGVSPTGHFTTIIPLTLVLFAVAVKEIIEDLVSFNNNSCIVTYYPYCLLLSSRGDSRLITRSTTTLYKVS